MPHPLASLLASVCDSLTDIRRQLHTVQARSIINPQIRHLATRPDFSIFARGRMEKLLACPICHDPFTQAVEVQCCSKCYCLKCIEQWINDATSGEKPSCPSCRSPLEQGKWKENKPLQALANDLPAVCGNVSNGVRAWIYHCETS